MGRLQKHVKDGHCPSLLLSHTIYGSGHTVSIHTGTRWINLVKIQVGSVLDLSTLITHTLPIYSTHSIRNLSYERCGAEAFIEMVARQFRLSVDTVHIHSFDSWPLTESCHGILEFGEFYMPVSYATFSICYTPHRTLNVWLKGQSAIIWAHQRPLSGFGRHITNWMVTCHNSSLVGSIWPPEARWVRDLDYGCRLCQNKRLASILCIALALTVLPSVLSVNVIVYNETESSEVQLSWLTSTILSLSQLLRLSSLASAPSSSSGRRFVQTAARCLFLLDLLPYR